MTTKTIYKFFILFLLLIFVCCKVKKLEAHGEPSPCTVAVFSPENKNYFFENWYKVDSSQCEDKSVHIYCKDYIYRDGYFKNSNQDGKWTTMRYLHYDSLGHNKSREYIFREEYFKNGLRDSIYKIFSKEGKVVYSTYFKNGNGVEKDFHNNGKLHYEIATKDGYFTDTLKLYNDEGKLKEKLL